MIVGIDIGGTKTHLMGEDEHGRIGERTLATSEWRGRREAERDASMLVSLINGMVGDRTPTAVVVGSHGCDTDEECSKLQAQLASQLSGTVLVLNDSELLLPAAGKPDGISVISGTGSIAVGRNRNRKMIAAGGWGWYLGDEGSASGLVREAARAVRGSLDAGGALDGLGRALMDALGIKSPVEFGRALSDIGSAAGIGELAPIVFQAADDGSSLASGVIEYGGEALALLAARLIARGAKESDVVTGGGVITRQPRLFEAFSRALANKAPKLSLTLLKEPPVKGAILLARRLATGERPASLPLPHVAGKVETTDDGRAA
ncbi:BadF/BadG/BcrA/BcrD ATPase family protein [Rhizobium jaguaris]|uniref:N-acetylglucosamine kinase n=1 Tax=Rhizobium jaguaris TaxID=1312183 RepID=UPI0039BF6B98